MRRSLGSRLLSRFFSAVNRFVPWHRLLKWIGAINLKAFRDELRERNLHDTTKISSKGGPTPPPYSPRHLYARTADGSYNDLSDPAMGMTGTRFARNAPLERCHPEEGAALMEPSPRLISRRLMAREQFTPATTLNLLAAAWIQFQTHDWFNHGRDQEAPPLEVPLEDGDPWGEMHGCPMKILRTTPDPTRSSHDGHGPPTYTNTNSHWWDASGIYGSDAAMMRRLRSGRDGKLRVLNRDGDRMLPVEAGSDEIITGFNDNWWLGLDLLHTVFTLEHNSICDRLRRQHPHWTDDQLYDTARLINAALMAKIHTVEWTPAILAHPTLRIAMDSNWWGLAGETISRIAGRLSDSEAVSGIVGSPTDHHGAPYQLTEEFVSVYRLHPLIPDDVRLYSAATGKVIHENLKFMEIAGANTRKIVDGPNVNMADALYSFGIAHPGAVTLHNFPDFLRDFETPDGHHIDLAAVDIMRDRERGVLRYNDFREMVHRPRVKTFEQLTSNREWAAELREVYHGDIDRVDLMVGMFAEDLPKGFGFSDTAFRVFILMASRRLKSDRFFTTDYTPRVYTQTGMDWINSNTMVSVLLRHYPELRPALREADNAFAPWTRFEETAAGAEGSAQGRSVAVPTGGGGGDGASRIAAVEDRVRGSEAEPPEARSATGDAEPESPVKE